MASSAPDVDAARLFKVEGLVAVITGGGSGELLSMPRRSYDEVESSWHDAHASSCR
jgi:hypothetical protein